MDYLFLDAMLIDSIVEDKGVGMVRDSLMCQVVIPVNKDGVAKRIESESIFLKDKDAVISGLDVLLAGKMFLKGGV